MSLGAEDAEILLTCCRFSIRHDACCGNINIGAPRWFSPTLSGRKFAAKRL